MHPHPQDLSYCHSSPITGTDSGMYLPTHTSPRTHKHRGIDTSKEKKLLTSLGEARGDKARHLGIEC